MKGKRFRFAAAVGVGVIAATVSTRPVSAQGLENRVKVLEERVGQLEQRVKRLEGEAGTTAAESGKRPAGKRAEPRGTPYRRSPISVKFVEKKIHETNLPSGEVEKKIAFVLIFTNGLRRTVTRFEGDLVVMDKQGSEIVTMALVVSRRVAPGDETSWFGGLDLEQAQKKQSRLLSVSDEDLLVVFNLHEAVYADGSKERFTRIEAP